MAGLAHDEGRSDLAEPLVRNADERYVTYRFMLTDGCLDLGRIDVEATDDKHVLQSSGDLHVTL